MKRFDFLELAFAMIGTAATAVMITNVYWISITRSEKASHEQDMAHLQGIVSILEEDAKKEKEIKRWHMKLILMHQGGMPEADIEKALREMP